MFPTWEGEFIGVIVGKERVGDSAPDGPRSDLSMANDLRVGSSNIDSRTFFRTLSRDVLPPIRMERIFGGLKYK